MIKTIFIDTQHIESRTCDFFVYQTLPFHFTKITHPAKQAIGDAGSST